MVLDPLGKILGNWSQDINIYSILFRLVLAVLCGGFIGAERSNKHQNAGLRTNIIVALGSCVAMIINCFLGDKSDTARLGAAVITGIGFIGAGCIMVTSRMKVTGITTAAAIWMSGCVGLGIGCGFYTVSLIATLICLLTLFSMPRIESKLKEKTRGYELHIELYSRPDLSKLLEFVRKQDIRVRSISYDPAYANSGLSVYSIFFYANGKKYVSVNELVELLSKKDYIHHVEII